MDLASFDGDMYADMSRSRSPAAAAAACVEYTYPHADLAVRAGNMCTDLSQTRSPAAIAAACVGTTSPCAGLAVRDGSMDEIAACCVGQTGQRVDLPDKALYAACVDTCLPAVLAAVSSAAEEAYAKKKPPKGRPWPKDRFLREIKRIRPDKIVIAGPDHIRTSSTLAQLRHFG